MATMFILTGSTPTMVAPTRFCAVAIRARPVQVP